MKKIPIYDSTVDVFRTYENIDLNNVNEYCFVIISQNYDDYNSPCFGRIFCTPSEVGFQMAVAQNDGTLYVRGHNYARWSEWKTI